MGVLSCVFECVQEVNVKKLKTCNLTKTHCLSSMVETGD
jgi:hypothetical protein